MLWNSNPTTECKNTDGKLGQLQELCVSLKQETLKAVTNFNKLNNRQKSTYELLSMVPFQWSTQLLLKCKF